MTTVAGDAIATPRLELRDITKSYPSVVANNRVNLLYDNMLDRIHALSLDQVLIQTKSDLI